MPEVGADMPNYTKDAIIQIGETVGIEIGD